MDQKLAGLRAGQEKATNAAADIAVQQALRNADQSRLGDQGGGSSYQDRLAIGATAPIRVQAALQNEAQKRADLGYVTQNQLGLAGKRNDMNAALAAYGLTPYTTAANIQGRNLGLLSGITNLDQANTFYGLKQAQNKWADIADSLDAGLLNGVAAYSSVAGGMRRGGLVMPMQRYSEGGPVDGPGTTHSDSIPIRVSVGEYVVPASAVRLPGALRFLERLRHAGLASEGAAPLGGAFNSPSRFDEGGMVLNWGVGEGNPSPGQGAHSLGGEAAGWAGGGGGGGGGMPGGGGGGGGGGLAGSAQQLNARSMADQFPVWQQATFVPVGGGQMGSWGMPTPTQTGTSPMGMQMPQMQMPKFDYTKHFADLWGPQAVPDNFSQLPADQQREYINMYANARRMEQEQFKNGVNPYE